MGMAIPLGIQVAGMIGSHFAGKAAKKSAMQLTPEEQQYYANSSGAAAGAKALGDTSATQSGKLFDTGMPAVSQATNYYSTLLRGNRAQMTQAVAPEAAGINDTYAGASRAIEHGGARGAARDQAVGEIAREKAGKVAGLIGGVRPQAAAALANTGLSTVSEGSRAAGTASSAYGNVGSIYGNLIGNRGADRQSANTAGEAASSSIGALTAQVLKTYSNYRAGSGGSKSPAGAQ